MWRGTRVGQRIQDQRTGCIESIDDVFPVYEGLEADLVRNRLNSLRDKELAEDESDGTISHIIDSRCEMFNTVSAAEVAY